MKGRSQTTDPPEDWLDGSWIVDCICGVTYDDGEEMVNCDLCNVWVHTRCSGYVRGEKSFVCDNCKINDSEETEVAQLLVELPNKTLNINNTTLNSNTNTNTCRSHKLLWTDRPIEERVHVQGIPGGGPHPSLFPSIFSSELWKCTGYVPKKFSFCYREFPCWEDRDNRDGRDKQNTDEGKNNENIINNGAGVLYSLSKQTQIKKASQEKLHPTVIQCGKRSRENSKDRGGKKKNKVVPVHDKRDKINGFKADVHPRNARQVEVCESKTRKGCEADDADDKHEQAKDAGSQEVASNLKHYGGTQIEMPQRNAANHERNLIHRSSEVSALGYISDKSIKPEKLSHDASNSAKSKVTLPSVVKDRGLLKKEGLLIDDLDTIKDEHIETPTNKLLMSKPLVVNVPDSALEVQYAEICSTSVDNMLLISTCCNSETKLDANADKLKEISSSFPSAAVVKSGCMKEVNETAPAIFHTCVHEGLDGDNDSVANVRQLKKEDKVTDSSCSPNPQCEGSESSIETPKMASDCNEVPRFVGESVIEDFPPPSLNLRKMVSARKSSLTSSTIVISKSPLSGRSRTVCSPTPGPIGNGMITSSSIGTIKESAPVDPKNQDKHKKPKSIAKDNPKSPLSSALKASEVNRATSSPVLKESTSVGKDCPKHPSSRSSLVESSLRPLGVGDPASSLQPHHAELVQNKNLTSSGQQRGEKAPQSNLQSSSKWTQSGFPDVPSSSISPAGLSDEELALLLHQELNSSPRVPRVPRVRHVGSLPQLSASSSSMLIKRTSSSGGKDQHTFSRKKNKDVLKDGSRGSFEGDNDVGKGGRQPSSPDSAKISDALSPSDVIPEAVHSAKKSIEQISTAATCSDPFSIDFNRLKVPFSGDKLVNSREDDIVSINALAPTHHTLPGLIAEIMGKGRRMTYEELCNAVLPHWQNLRKHNGEKYAYSSHSQAVLDCLRNRPEWARLVDRGPKTTASRKKRKIDAEPADTESDDGENRTFKGDESKSFKSNKEECSKGSRRYVRKSCSSGVQARGTKTDRKSRKVEPGSDETGSFSDFGESVSSEDGSQGSGTCAT